MMFRRFEQSTVLYNNNTKNRYFRPTRQPGRSDIKRPKRDI